MPGIVPKARILSLVDLRDFLSDGGGGGGGVGGRKKKALKMTSKPVDWSFSELFFLIISRKKNSKTSKGNQQSILNL